MNTQMKRKPRPAPARKANRNDKSYNEGIYANARMTQVATSLIGCSVQIQVDKGTIYEGILKTFSPKMEIVLEMVHMIGEGSMMKDTLKDKMIFNLSNIVMLTALDVDTEYATKDNFTDGAISGKFNGCGSERELQPWIGDDASEAIETLDSPVASNGWNAEEMFKTNAEKFKINSSYNPDLTQYTTPLVKEDTQEYREKEQLAERQALEIEKSESYRKHQALENGDEEMAFSAVVRPQDKTSNGKYVPPQRRRGMNQGQATRPNFTNGPSSQPTQPASVAKTTSASSQQQQMSTSTSSLSSMGSGSSPVISATVSAQSPQHKPASNPPTPTDEIHSSHSRNDDRKSESSERVRSSDNGPSSLSSGSENTASNEKHEPASSKATPGKKSSHTIDSKQNTFQELKTFKDNFKLHAVTPSSVNSPQTPEASSAPVATTTSQVSAAAAVPSSSEQMQGSGEDSGEKKEEISEKVKKSTLNPNAKEFNPNAKPFVPRQNVPTTPPVMPAVPMPIPTNPVIYQLVNPVNAPMVNPQAPQPRYQVNPNTGKKATVSLQQPRPELTQAAAAAVTGTPILAPAQNVIPQQNHNQQYPMAHYFQNPNVPGAPGVYSQQVLQSRMMTPPSNMSMMTGGQPGENTIQQPPQNMPPAQPVIMPGAAIANGPAMSHMPAGHPQATPPHSSHTPSGHQHNPSPVPHHPPNSNTPQSHMAFNHNQTGPGMANNPPLQPSPHTPTSPQYPPQAHHMSGYPSQQPPHQTVPNPLQMSYSHSGAPPTVTHATHFAHSHMPQQQFMIPQTSAMASVSQPGPPPSHLTAVSMPTNPIVHQQGAGLYHNNTHIAPQSLHGNHQVAGQAGPAMVPQLSLPAHPQQVNYMHPQMAPSQGPPPHASHPTNAAPYHPTPQ